MAYLTNSEQDIKEMLKTIGVDDFEDLIKNIPEALRFRGELNLPAAESEFGVQQAAASLAAKNEIFTSFLGGGAYDHYIPAVVTDIASRPEFYTSYTPYQPEVSQGTLQTMYEFQSQISALTGMDVTNASMYEAGSALAEAVLLAVAHTRLKKVLLPETLNWRYKQIIKTYTANLDIELIEIPAVNFVIDTNALLEQFTDDTAAVIVQHPNYYGFLEDMEAAAELCKNKKALLIHAYDPISLGLLKTPGAYGADIAVAEGQALGNAQNYGGPYAGLFSVSDKLVRKMPGRLSGVTRDVDGKRGFVLTLQTREQHIRREKATSNICTNSGLLTLTAAVYLASLGKKGIQDVAQLCVQKAHYLADKLYQIDGIEAVSDAPFFKEFTIALPVPADQVIKKALQHQIFAGISLKKVGHPNHLLVAVTEKRTVKEMDAYVSMMKKIIK